MKYIGLKKIGVNVVLMLAIILLSTLFGTIELAAQSTPGPPIFPSNPDPAPIDGGLVLLAAAGSGYAIKKLRDRKR